MKFVSTTQQTVLPPAGRPPLTTHHQVAGLSLVLEQTGLVESKRRSVHQVGATPLKQRVRLHLVVRHSVQGGSAQHPAAAGPGHTQRGPPPKLGNTGGSDSTPCRVGEKAPSDKRDGVTYVKSLTGLTQQGPEFPAKAEQPQEYTGYTK